MRRIDAHHALDTGSPACSREAGEPSPDICRGGSSVDHCGLLQCICTIIQPHNAGMPPLKLFSGMTGDDGGVYVAGSNTASAGPHRIFAGAVPASHRRKPASRTPAKIRRKPSCSPRFADNRPPFSSCSPPARRRSLSEVRMRRKLCRGRTSNGPIRDRRRISAFLAESRNQS